MVIEHNEIEEIKSIDTWQIRATAIYFTIPKFEVQG
jgi:hypothetical protein